jgi:hypothetical protein
MNHDNKIGGQHDSDDMDDLAFSKVDRALQREPGFRLPPDFSDRVIARIETKPESSKDMVWLGAGIFAFIIAAIVAVAFTDFKLNFGVLKFISGYPGLVAFGVLFVIVLQWIDKKVIQKKLAA